MVHVVGGNVNSRLNSWLRDLGIHDFIHVKLETNSIDPLELRKSAIGIREYVRDASALIAIGPVADALLVYAFLDHCTLPNTGKGTTKKELQKNLEDCRKYLMRRIHDTSIYSGPTSS